MHVCCVDMYYISGKFVILIWQFVEFSSIAKLPIIFQQGIVEVALAILINLPN